mmetsp:Transcript_9134/g.19150  ORF Transcript_9134/g.19150 Transcript_9134/m.19150 type:complete len:204 (-) Transcript_9134:111-722(-)
MTIDNCSYRHLLLRQIENNDLPLLEISKEVEDVFHGCHDGDIRYDDITILLRALVRNESISSISFEGDFLDCLHPLRRSELIRAIGSYLPSLEHVGLGDSPILVDDLCHLLTKSISLRSLHLHDCILQGLSEDFRDLESALLHHPSIREFEVQKCTSTDSGTDWKTLENAGKRQRIRSSLSYPQQLPLSPLLAMKKLTVAKSA